MVKQFRGERIVGFLAMKEFRVKTCRVCISCVKEHIVVAVLVILKVRRWFFNKSYL